MRANQGERAVATLHLIRRGGDACRGLSGAVCGVACLLGFRGHIDVKLCDVSEGELPSHEMKEHPMDQASYFKYDRPFVTGERCPYCGRPWEKTRNLPLLGCRAPAGEYWRYSKDAEHGDLSLRDEHELFYAKRMNRGEPYFHYDVPAGECRPGFKSVEPRSIPFFQYDEPTDKCWRCSKEVKHRGMSACDDCALLKKQRE